MEDEFEKPYKFNHKNIKIAVAGVSSKIGTTTTAFNMSKLLFEIGSKVSYTEANSNEHLKEIAAYYEFAKVKNYYKYKGIEYYPNKQFPDDYNFNIFDLEIIDSRSTAIFNSCDIKILCSGNLPSRAKQIMFYLINRANTEGTCFPSVRTMARDCGVSERTIQRAMKVLIKDGYVVKENRYRDNGGQSSNLYKLQMDIEPNNDTQPKKSRKKIKEVDLVVEEEKANDIEIIETVTFDDYIKCNENEGKNLKSEEKTAPSIPVKKYINDINNTIKSKCHPILYQHKTIKYANLRIAKIANFLCRGVDVNLCPP